MVGSTRPAPRLNSSKLASRRSFAAWLSDSESSLTKSTSQSEQRVNPGRYSCLQCGQNMMGDDTTRQGMEHGFRRGWSASNGAGEAYSNGMSLRRIVGCAVMALLLASAALPATCGACMDFAAKPACGERHGAGASAKAAFHHERPLRRLWRPTRNYRQGDGAACSGVSGCVSRLRAADLRTGGRTERHDLSRSRRYAPPG